VAVPTANVIYLEPDIYRPDAARFANRLTSSPRDEAQHPEELPRAAHPRHRTGPPVQRAEAGTRDRALYPARLVRHNATV
jgi:hypothetical protein